MIRISLLLVLLVAGRAHADPLAAGGFDAARLTAVYSEALAFVAPRILEPVPVPQLALWGLQGLTELDPGLRVATEGGRLVLLRQDQAVSGVPRPDDESPAAWAAAAVALTAAGLPVSAPLRRAGVQAIVDGFFGRMFGRLDPYSRYVPPTEASAERDRRAGRAGLGLAVGRRALRSR